MNRVDSIGRTLLACLFACLSFAATAAQLAAPTLAGKWHATMQTAAGSYALELSVKRDAQGGLTASLESVDQAPGEAIPVSGVSLDQDQLTLTIDALGAAYVGRFDAALDTWQGHWRQGREMPLNWERGPLAQTPTVAGIDGDWRASLNRNGADLRLVLHVRTSSHGTRAKLDSPDMGIAGLDVVELTRDGERIGLKIPQASVVFKGELSEGAGNHATALSGRWQRQGMPTATVRFTRPAQPPVAAAARPQTPAPPFAYRVEQVRFANPRAGITLAGTLSLPPAGAGVRYAAAVLVSGSGPQDRDETLSGHKPFAVLADHLTRQGIAVLRFDVRGVGESGGRFDGAGNADLASDVRAAVDYLVARRDVDPQAIGLIGHSQGGIVAPLAALNNPAVGYLVLLAAPGTSMSQLLLAQRQMTVASLRPADAASATTTQRQGDALATLFEASARAPDRAQAAERVGALLTPELLRQLGADETQKSALIGELTGDWLRDVLRYDAAATLKGLRVPILALGGSVDRQVPTAENLAAIGRAGAGNRDVTTLELPGLNHMFQRARSGAIAEYAEITETFAPAALDVISGWIVQRFGAGVKKPGA